MMAGYLQNGGNVTDIEKIKNYSSTHMHKIANSLVISIKVNNDGLIGDTVKWDNHTVPIDMLNPPKTKWHVMLLDPISKTSIFKIALDITDSIITSNVLVKE